MLFICCPHPSCGNRHIHRVPQTTSTFCFLNKLCQKLTEFNNFWQVRSWEKLTCKSYRFVHFVRCRHFTLGNPKKSIFNSIIHTYFWLFMLSQKKTTCNPLAHPTWKCHHSNLWIAKLFHLTEGLLRSFKRWRLWREPVVGCHQWLWKEPVVMCVNWNVRHAMSQQVFRVITFCVNIMLPVFYDTDQSQSTPRRAEIQTMLQQAAAASLNMSASTDALLL